MLTGLVTGNTSFLLCCFCNMSEMFSFKISSTGGALKLGEQQQQHRNGNFVTIAVGDLGRLNYHEFGNGNRLVRALLLGHYL